MRGNAICERLIGTLRREVLDRTLILNQVHLRAVLAEYQGHYNTARPHQGIDQRVPDPAPAPRVTAADPARGRSAGNRSWAASSTNTSEPPEPRRPRSRPEYYFRAAQDTVPPWKSDLRGHRSHPTKVPGRPRQDRPAQSGHGPLACPIPAKREEGSGPRTPQATDAPFHAEPSGKPPASKAHDRTRPAGYPAGTSH
jgi:hypothetical protein